MIHLSNFEDTGVAARRDDALRRALTMPPRPKANKAGPPPVEPGQPSPEPDAEDKKPGN